MAEDGASYTRMSSSVASRLAAVGFQQPVDLNLLPESWWVLKVDAAALHDQMESGGVTMMVEANTAEIAHRFNLYFCEVIGGPYDTWEDMNGCVWVISGFDPASLGPRALPCNIPGWIAQRLQDQGHATPIPFSKLADAYWVCGMGGGVLSTREPETRMRSGSGLLHSITDGPFGSHADASYAFDVLWESPD